MLKLNAMYGLRNMEDFVTWVDTSAIKRHIMEYNELVSDVVIETNTVFIKDLTKEVFINFRETISLWPDVLKKDDELIV